MQNGFKLERVGEGKPQPIKPLVDPQHNTLTMVDIEFPRGMGSESCAQVVSLSEERALEGESARSAIQ